MCDTRKLYKKVKKKLFKQNLIFDKNSRSLISMLNVIYYLHINAHLLIIQLQYAIKIRNKYLRY